VSDPDPTAVRQGAVVVLGEVGATDRGGLTSLLPTVHIQWPADVAVSSDASGRIASLDGAAIVGNRLIAHPGALLSSWGQLSIRDFADHWGEHAKQSACAYLWDPTTQTLAILPDPLGGATLFRHVQGGRTLLSTDYAALIQLARSLGSPPEKELMYQVERTVFGNGGLWDASYRGTTRVPAFHHVIIEDSSPRDVRYGSFRVMVQHTSYFEALSRIRTDVLESVEAISDAVSSDRLAHLTGGFDSRLVLGALLETGVSSRFAFFCSGPPTSSDRRIADGLARTFGLVRSHSAGMVPAIVGESPEQQVALLRYTAGLSNVGPTGREQTVDTVAAGGGYGELFRSFYSRSLPGDGPHAWSDGKALATAMVGSDPAQGGILTPHAFELIGARLSRLLTEISERGVPDDLVGDIFYSELRNRYHMGATSLFWSRVGTRVNPLYSVHALAGARELPALARRSNVLGYDLMESFGHNLSRYPFDTDRSSPEYRRQRRPRTPLTFRDGPLTWSTRARPTVSSVVVAPVPIQRREALQQRAQALGLNQWQSDQLEATQARLGSVLEQLDLRPYADVLNLDYVQDLACTREWTRTRVRQLYAASSMLMWYSDDD
jgi:hypothetical protein